jgi:hypothetical protein
MVSSEVLSTPTVVDNVLARYRHLISVAGDLLQGGRSNLSEPAFVPPQTEGAWLEYFSASAIAIRTIEPLGLNVLDMTQNPGTRTTKTIGSLLIVARAISHYEQTGERIALLTPSSGNKVTALRDAVCRAYRLSLATTDTLRIISVVPSESAFKVRHCVISDDPGTSSRNPIFVRRCEPADLVREEAQAVQNEYGDAIRRRYGWRLWNTSDAANYAHGDCVRAFLEDEFLPSRSSGRWHVHAVSSGFGLLGYNVGYDLLVKPRSPHASFLLVQQLATPALVLAVSASEPPAYQQRNGGFAQSTHLRFPGIVTNPHEVVDPTFYARQPKTLAAVREVIRRHGGDGIVVSKKECMARFAYVRDCLMSVGFAVPADPHELREWSTVMAFTGLLLANERGLIPGDAEIVLHATGLYTDSVLRPAAATDLISVSNARELARQIEQVMQS